MRLTLNHFATAILFALFSSVVLGVVTKRTDAERWTYGLRCFGWFLVALFGIGWAMRLLHG
jgi:ABC-type dipeptide/oligopeptide/nickel transport system permease component